MRLQIFLSHSGICSRRKALELVQSGRVKVNGVVVREPSHQTNPDQDIVILDNRRVFPKEKIYILLNKPVGITTTKKDRFAKRTVMDLLPLKYKHLFPVGRLDKDTEGLLILTNDGDLSYKLAHPSFRIDKVYEASLDKVLTENHKKRFQGGIRLDGILTSECKIVILKARKVKITIHEGRKRQIRRMFAMFRYKVNDLKRLSLGNLNLGDLPVGHWRKISSEELLGLRSIIKANR